MHSRLITSYKQNQMI